MKDQVWMGWDAAWTPNGTGAWAVARGRNVILHEITPKGDALLERLKTLLQEYSPGTIGIDLPVAAGGVRGWRAADLETTRAFSRYGCPVHSPTPERPGGWGDRITNILDSAGYHLAVSSKVDDKAYAEVYPHTALLEIHRRVTRLPYKAGRSKQYWPELSREERVAKLLEMYRETWRRLGGNWNVPGFPEVGEAPKLKDLKAMEDLTDALVCLHAARGIREGTYLPYGDLSAAIWNPLLQ